jgi:hypothetical protein
LVYIGLSWHSFDLANERLYRTVKKQWAAYRMVSVSIGDVPAATFAEYVDDPFFGRHRDGASASQASSEEEDEYMKDAPPRAAPQLELARKPQPEATARCIAVRPALTHHFYSHRLHVRAKAKL